MIKCKHCNDVIKSEHRHDLVTCSCGKVSVDGGNDYLRLIGDQKDYETVSSTEKEKRQL